VSGRLPFVAAVASVVAVLAIPAAAQAQSQVNGLEVRQGDGFATLSWERVAGATDYQIERTEVDAAGAPVGPAAITGVWRPNRTVTPQQPAFADAGFNPGDRFQWRVRARIGTQEGAWSAPVSGTTVPPFGDPATPGQNLRTQWELTQAAQYTSDVNEYEYTAALDAASDRVRVVEIGRTIENRPINMFIIGYPAPPPTAQAISNTPTALVNCNVHGNEPSSREACLILARELAFGSSPRIFDILSHATILLVPSINGDGRAHNTRGNLTGQDLNRDHSLLREPETFAFSEMLRDYTPEAAFDGHEFGNSRAGDLPVLPPRHLNVARPIFEESRSLVEGWMYGNGSKDGWWFCPYGCENGGDVGLSQETILRNTMGLKSTVGSLLEARSSGGPTRPNESNAPNNRRRKTYSAIYTYQQFFDYYRASRPAIARSIKESQSFQKRNQGRIVFRGGYDIPAYPAPHPGESPPPDEHPTPDLILETPPCGYTLTAQQYLAPGEVDPETGRAVRSVRDRLEAHGIKVQRRGLDTYFVPMKQELRGLIPLLLDAQAVEEMVGGQREDC
jgi:hypothetical protein